MEIARFPLPAHKWKTGKEPPLHMLQTTPQAAIFAFVLFQHRLELSLPELKDEQILTSAVQATVTTNTKQTLKQINLSTYFLSFQALGGLDSKIQYQSIF